MSHEDLPVDPWGQNVIRPLGRKQETQHILGGSMGELRDAMYAAARLDGPAAGWELWRQALEHWDSGAAKAHARWLLQTCSNEDFPIAEYINDNTTLVLQLRKHGMSVTDLGQVEAWFRSAALKMSGDRTRGRGPVDRGHPRSVPPAQPQPPKGQIRVGDPEWEQKAMAAFLRGPHGK